MLDVLRRVTQEVNSAKDLQSALDIIVERVQMAMSTEVVSVYLLDAERREYVFRATRGLNPDAVGKVTLAMDEGLVGLVGQRAEPINLKNASKHPNFKFVSDLQEDLYNTFLGVPIIHHRKLLGVLVVQQKRRRRFDEGEESFLITLSAQLAGVIAHARATGALTHQQTKATSSRFDGKSGATGIAMGTSVVMFPEADLSSVPDRATKDVAKEVAEFKMAVEETRLEIGNMSRSLADQLPPEELGLFEAYLHMLDDTAISGEVVAMIETGVWCQTALRKVIDSHVSTFEAMEDAYLRERGADVLDLGQRVLANLQKQTSKRPNFPRKTILIAHELTPAMLASVPRSKLQGLVSMKGSGSSHVAILAKALGVPTVMGVNELPIHLLESKPVIVDANAGFVITYPDKDQQNHYRRLIKEEQDFNEGLDELKEERSETSDGHRVRLWVNTGLMTDAAMSLDRGAEGVGLYRTEVHFMMNDRFPTEEEQRLIYREHLKAFSPRPVTMRTLDIGGDKALSYFPIQEENPFLGWRGIRVTLDHPEIFLGQVRAMIRANEGTEAYLRIMLPMISSTSEVDEAQRLIEQCYREIIEEGIEVERPDVGVMIEVPAAVYQARDIIRRVDFLSVGSNDLIQYMLAVDRNNAQVADLYQEFHPAVLHALKHVVDAAHGEGKPLGICGEMAGNPGAAILLTAMGFDVLSMNATNLLKVKWVIRSFSMERAKKVLSRTLKMDNAYEIKNYVEEELRKAGLSQLIRDQSVGR